MGLFDSIIRKKEKSEEKQASDLFNKGIDAYNKGDAKNAVNYFEKALNIYEKLQDYEQVASLLGNLGTCYRHVGEIEKAIESCDRAIEISRKIGRKDIEANAFQAKGNIGVFIKNWDLAIECFGNAGKLYEEVGNVDDSMAYYRNQLLAMVEKSNALIDAEKYDEGLKLRDDMEAIAKKLGEDLQPPKEEHIFNIAINILSTKGQESALKYFIESAKIAEEKKNNTIEEKALANIIQAYIDLGDLNNAEKYCQMGLDKGYSTTPPCEILPRLEDDGKIMDVMKMVIQSLPIEGTFEIPKGKYLFLCSGNEVYTYIKGNGGASRVSMEYEMEKFDKDYVIVGGGRYKITKKENTIHIDKL